MISEIIQIIWYSFSSTIDAIVQFIIQAFPDMIELHQVLSNLTPVGIIAITLGVPTFLISALRSLIKKVSKCN